MLTEGRSTAVSSRILWDAVGAASGSGSASGAGLRSARNASVDCIAAPFCVPRFDVGWCCGIAFATWRGKVYAHVCLIDIMEDYREPGKKESAIF
jgi:hypothetical protein